MGQTNIDWQRLQDLERKFLILEQRVSAIDNQPPLPTNNPPDQPRSLVVDAVTSTSVALTWTQVGAISKTEVFRRLRDGAFTSTPQMTILGSGNLLHMPDLTPDTNYDIGLVAVSGSERSAMAIVKFKTSSAPAPAGLPAAVREVTISSARMAAAIAAALAAADGSKNAAFTASARSGLTKAVIVDRADATVQRHIETLSLTSDATKIQIEVAGTLVSSIATTLAGLKDGWLELQNPSDATDNLCIPAGNDALAKYLIDSDWGAGAQVVRQAPVVLSLPSVAFDSASSGGGSGSGSGGSGGSSGGPAGSIDFLLSEMVLPFDYPAKQPAIFGFGDGTSGVIQSITLTEAGTPGWDNTQYTPGTDFGNLLPWLVIYPGANNFNNGSWLLEIWDFYAEIFYLSEGYWRVMNGSQYPTSTFDFALYTSGNGGAGIVLLDPVPWKQVTPGRRAFECVLPNDPTRLVAFHNSVGSGEQVPPNKILDVKCIKTEFKCRYVPSGNGTFDTSGAQMMGQSACDLYERPWQGHVASGQMSRLKKITNEEQIFAMTWVRPQAAMHIDAPRNPSLAPPSLYPAPESWLRANPPPRYA